MTTSLLIVEFNANGLLINVLLNLTYRAAHIIRDLMEYENMKKNI